MQQTDNHNEAATDGGKYRFFADPGHGWLEVSRSEVVASGTKVSGYSYYDPLTDMAYLEEDSDAPQFLKAVGKNWDSVGRTLYSSAPRELPHYGAEALEAFMDNLTGLGLYPTGSA